MKKVMVTGVYGWPDEAPSWVRAVRDGPLALGGRRCFVHGLAQYI